MKCTLYIFPPSVGIFFECIQDACNYARLYVNEHKDRRILIVPEHRVVEFSSAEELEESDIGAVIEF